LLAQDFCEPPIHHQNFAERSDHYVCGLQVAMQYALRMREGHGVANAQK
jgi:hypothetical protein